MKRGEKMADMTKIIGATIAIAVSVIGHRASPLADLCGCNSSCTYDRGVHRRRWGTRRVQLTSRGYRHPDCCRGHDGCGKAHFQQELISGAAPGPGLLGASKLSIKCVL